MRFVIIVFLLINIGTFAQTNEERGTIKVGNGCEKFLANDTIFSKVDSPPSFKGVKFIY